MTIRPILSFIGEWLVVLIVILLIGALTISWIQQARIYFKAKSTFALPTSSAPSTP